MSEQPRFSPQHIKKAELNNTLLHSEEKGLLLRIVDAWCRFAGISKEQAGTSVEEQERVRHSRLLSIILFCSGLMTLFLIPTAIPVPAYWVPIILNLSFSLIALFLNRAGKVTIAGIFFVIAIDVTIIVNLKTLPTGIRNSNIPDFDFFILPVLISGCILPRRIIPFIVMLHIVIIIALFNLLPHDVLLTEEIRVNQGGFAYSEISDALIIQIVGGAIAWMGAWSVDRALQRASRAEDLAEARRRLNEQNLQIIEQKQQIIEQKQRLDHGIEIVKDAQARFANGDFKARARLQDNELAPLAMSFNLLAERLNRITRIAQDHTRLEQALQQLVDIQEAILHGGTIKSYQPTGTLVDRIQPIIQRYRQLSSLLSQNRSSLDTLRKDLAQEQALLAELNAVLSQLFAAARAFPSSNDISGSQSSRSSSSFASSQATNSLDLSTYLNMQINLIEKAEQIRAQLDRQKKQSLQEVKGLTNQLPDTAVFPAVGKVSSKEADKNKKD
jgi:hypothetical protein